MSSLQEFALHFDGRPVPDALARLPESQHEPRLEEYAESFGLLHADKSGPEHGGSPTGLPPLRLKNRLGSDENIIPAGHCHKTYPAKDCHHFLIN